MLQRVHSHNQNDNINVVGDGMNRDELISSIDNIECGSNSQNTDFDSAITNAMIDLHDNGHGSGERILLNLSFCDDIRKTIITMNVFCCNVYTYMDWQIFLSA